MKRLFTIILLLILLVIAVGCAKRVSWQEIQEPKDVNLISDNELELNLNIDSDSVSQFQQLSKSEKISYVSRWSFMSTNFENKANVTNLSEAVDVKLYNSGSNNPPERFEFFFEKGQKFTVIIGGVRGG